MVQPVGGGLAQLRRVDGGGHAPLLAQEQRGQEGGELAAVARGGANEGGDRAVQVDKVAVLLRRDPGHQFEEFDVFPQVFVAAGGLYGMVFVKSATLVKVT